MEVWVEVGAILEKTDRDDISKKVTSGWNMGYLKLGWPGKMKREIFRFHSWLPASFSYSWIKTVSRTLHAFSLVSNWSPDQTQHVPHKTTHLQKWEDQPHLKRSWTLPQAQSRRASSFPTQAGKSNRVTNRWRKKKQIAAP